MGAPPQHRARCLGRRCPRPRLAVAASEPGSGRCSRRRSGAQLGRAVVLHTSVRLACAFVFLTPRHNRNCSCAGGPLFWELGRGAAASPGGGSVSPAATRPPALARGPIAAATVPAPVTTGPFPSCNPVGHTKQADGLLFKLPNDFIMN